LLLFDIFFQNEEGFCCRLMEYISISPQDKEGIVVGTFATGWIMLIIVLIIVLPTGAIAAGLLVRLFLWAAGWNRGNQDENGGPNE
jgi:hypothetical protein